MKYRYSIIESEQNTIESLKKCFEKFIEYSCVGISSTYDESLDLILDHTPNLVFIDLDNFGSDNCDNAFHFVNELYKYMQELPYIIALSSSTDSAYLSIKNGFFDYLLKPINSFEFRKAIAKLAQTPMEGSNKLCLKSYKDYRFIDIDEILFLKADNNSTDFFMENGSTISGYKTLKYYESILPENFTRIHNSYIINQNYVSRIHFGKSECTIKKSSMHIPFSRSYKKNVTILEKAISKKALLSLN